MPVTQSAKKALRRDRRREEFNKPIQSRLRTALIQAREDPNPENISNAYSVIDRAAKTNVIHKNKAARLKSKLRTQKSRV